MQSERPLDVYAEKKDQSPEKNSVRFHKDMTIGMPQMCIEGLSENWLFRELGSAHWDLLSEGLGTPSGALCDGHGNRLYATFVRIRIKSDVGLCDFVENEQVTLRGTISRYGNSMYLSKLSLTSKEDENKEFIAELITIFSTRQTEGNRKLQKGKVGINVNNILNLNDIPPFGLEYRMIKMQKLTSVTLSGHEFLLTDTCIFETGYMINPYYEVNGVGLLYFAAYPTINDTCEAIYFKTKRGVQNWESSYFTSSRDIMYYANCNASDGIVYKLHDIEHIENSALKISSSLYRRTDNVLMARIFVIKKPKLEWNYRSG